VPRAQHDGSLWPYFRLSRPEPLLFLPSSFSIVLTRLSHLIYITDHICLKSYQRTSLNNSFSPSLSLSRICAGLSVEFTNPYWSTELLHFLTSESVVSNLMSTESMTRHTKPCLWALDGPFIIDTVQHRIEGRMINWKRSRRNRSLLG
jgi:hypothetical protein